MTFAEDEVAVLMDTSLHPTIVSLVQEKSFPISLVKEAFPKCPYPKIAQIEGMYRRAMRVCRVSEINGSGDTFESWLDKRLALAQKRNRQDGWTSGDERLFSLVRGVLISGDTAPKRVAHLHVTHKKGCKAVSFESVPYVMPLFRAVIAHLYLMLKYQVAVLENKQAQEKRRRK